MGERQRRKRNYAKLTDEERKRSNTLVRVAQNRKERAKQSTGDASTESPSTTTTESKPKRASRSQTAVIADQVAKVEAKMEAQRVKNNLYAKR